MNRCGNGRGRGHPFVESIGLGHRPTRMPQGILPYEIELTVDGDAGVTARAGLPLVIETMRALGVDRAIPCSRNFKGCLPGPRTRCECRTRTSAASAAPTTLKSISTSYIGWPMGLSTRRAARIAAAAGGAALAFGLVSACGDGSNSPASFEQACSDYAKSYCTAVAACDPVGSLIGWSDLQNCGQRVALECTTTLVPLGVFASPSQVQSCGQAYSAAVCDAPLGYGPAVPTACGSNLADGAPCSVDWQCRQGSYCNRHGDSWCGTCAPLPVPKAGQACPTIQGLESCLVRSYDDGPPRGVSLVCCIGDQCCDPYGTCGGAGATCKQLASAGQSCAVVDPKAVGVVFSCGRTSDGTQLDCVGPVGGTGRCVPETTVAGQPCDPALTNGPGCWGRLVCNPASKTCIPVPVASTGESCAQWGICAGRGSCVAGECVAPVADGAPCGNDVTFCHSPATCVTGDAGGDGGSTGTCTLPSGLTACH